MEVYTEDYFRWSLDNLHRIIKEIIEIKKIIKESAIDSKVYDRLQSLFFINILNCREKHEPKFEQLTDDYLIVNPNNNQELLIDILRQNKDFFKELHHNNQRSFKKILLHIMSFNDLFNLIINKFDIEKSIDINDANFVEKVNYKIQGIIILMELLRKNNDNLINSKYYNKVKSFITNITKFILNNATEEYDVEYITSDVYLDEDGYTCNFINFVYEFMKHFNYYFFDIILDIELMCERAYEDGDIDGYWHNVISDFKEIFPNYNGSQIKEPKAKWFKF